MTFWLVLMLFSVFCSLGNGKLSWVSGVALYKLVQLVSLRAEPVEVHQQPVNYCSNKNIKTGWDDLSRFVYTYASLLAFYVSKTSQPPVRKSLTPATKTFPSRRKKPQSTGGNEWKTRKSESDSCQIAEKENVQNIRGIDHLFRDLIPFSLALRHGENCFN
ncbi:hypothetical protein RvY_15983-1 [Ramazzottius varieornatus]|uniref:Secreted protein n=1 Tax=Ramazzottius varieornatus TaxID=947166 RepID=A0A1D1W4P5_RAMVA|nr:hypothetical protein RvY_15983-1 [Ramazzottius varieornatus]